MKGNDWRVLKILVVVLAAGAVRFSGGGETLPSSVARRLRPGGIFGYGGTDLLVNS